MIDLNANKIELKGIALSKRDDIVAFVGAGCSRVLNIPLWNSLLIALNDKYPYYDSSDDLSDAIQRDDYPTVASNIESMYSDKNEYKKIIQNYSNPTSCYFTSLHVEIVTLTKTIITTNYDHTFEETLKSLKRSTRSNDYEYKSFSVGDLGIKGIGTNRHIYHIHGNNSDMDFILTEQSYKDRYKNLHNDVPTFINRILSEFNVLFIGFSFDDTFVVDFLEDTLKFIYRDPFRKSKPPRHFCIISDKLYKEYLTISDLNDIGLTNAKELITANILTEKMLDGKVVFYFTSTAEKEIQVILMEEKRKRSLFKKISELKSNKRKIQLFNELGIKPITYEDNDYLEIENILRELNEPVENMASSYVPN